MAEVAAETGISPATLFRWKDQALIDAGVRPGAPSVESDEDGSYPRCVRVVRRAGGDYPKRKIAIVAGADRTRILKSIRLPDHRVEPLNLAGVSAAAAGAGSGDPADHRRGRDQENSAAVPGTYGKRRIRAALLEEVDTVVSCEQPPLSAALVIRRGLKSWARSRGVPTKVRVDSADAGPSGASRRGRSLGALRRSPGMWWTRSRRTDSWRSQSLGLPGPMSGRPAFPAWWGSTSRNRGPNISAGSVPAPATESPRGSWRSLSGMRSGWPGPGRRRQPRCPRAWRRSSRRPRRPGQVS